MILCINFIVKLLCFKFVQVPPELSSLLEEGAAVVSPRPVNKMDGKDAPTFHVQLFDKSTNLAVTRIDPNAKVGQKILM